MSDNIQLFEDRPIRMEWNEGKEEWYFSVTDVVAVLTVSADSKQYIKKMRSRDPELNAKWGTICTLTAMKAADGKRYQMTAATIEGIFRIIQSIPSKHTVLLKAWLAQVDRERLLCYGYSELYSVINDSANRKLDCFILNAQVKCCSP